MFFGLPNLHLLEGLQASFRCAAGFSSARRLRKVTASLTCVRRRRTKIWSAQQMVVAARLAQHKDGPVGWLSAGANSGGVRGFECPGFAEARHLSVNKCKSQQAARRLEKKLGPAVLSARLHLGAVTFIPWRYQNVTILSYLRYGQCRAGSLQGRHSRVDCLTLPLPGIRSQNSSGRDGETTFGLVQALG